ncbi:MAG: PAS domain S-box protein [Cyanobacteria bacterium P01_G01_bin.38]
MLDPAEIKRFHLDWGPDFVEMVLDSIDSLVVVLNAEGQILTCNQACEALTGYRLSEMQGHFAWELFVPPEEQKAVKAILQKLQSGQRAPSAENHWITRSGERRLISWSNTLLLDSQDRLKYVVGTGIDVTNRQQAEDILRQQVAFEQLLGATARQIYNSLSLQATLTTAVTEIRQLLGADRALIFRFKPNWVGLVVVESLASEQWPATLGLQIRDPQLQTQFLAQYQQGQGSVINDIAQATDCPMSWLTHFQARAALITPILQGDALWGLLIVHQCAKPRVWQPLEITFLDQLATQLAIAIQQSELYEQIQRELNQRKRVEQVLQVAKDELEERVAERTADLKRLNEQLQRELNERQQAEANLERLGRQNELILNSMGEGLCGLNLNAEIMFANQAASKLLGHPVDTLVGKPISLVIIEPDEGHSALTPIYASLEDGSVYQATDTLFLRQNGDTFPAEYMSTPIRENGVIVGAVITFKDISQRQQIERMKDEFISVVSHELRTPLTSIHGSLRMLASGMLQNQPDKQHRLIEIAAKSTERLVRLINDVLDVERIAAGKLKVIKEACNIAALFQQAINTMYPLADKGEIWLLSSPIEAQIWADPDRILQTLTNLLSNAIKFSEAGGSVWVTAELMTADQLPDSNTMPISDTPYVCIAVSDQGRGIHPDQLEAIFERFQQADSSDARINEGTGLGLSICRSIIRQHGGHIWVESQPGKGSTFFFALPQYLPPSDNKPSVAHASP